MTSKRAVKVTATEEAAASESLPTNVFHNALIWAHVCLVADIDW